MLFLQLVHVRIHHHPARTGLEMDSAPTHSIQQLKSDSIVVELATSAEMIPQDARPREHCILFSSV